MNSQDIPVNAATPLGGMGAECPSLRIGGWSGDDQMTKNRRRCRHASTTFRHRSLDPTLTAPRNIGKSAVFWTLSAVGQWLQGSRGCAAPADVRRVLPAVATRRGRVPSPRVVHVAGGLARARAWGRGCCVASAYASAPGGSVHDRVRFPHAGDVGPGPLKIIAPWVRGHGAPGPFREPILAGFPLRGYGRDPR